MAYEQGDVVWVWMPYSDGVSGEDKPCVVVSTRRRNRGKDIVAGQLTGQVAKARRRGEYVLQHWAFANLTKPKAFRPKVFVALKGRVKRIGRLHDDDIAGVLASIRELFGL